MDRFDTSEEEKKNWMEYVPFIYIHYIAVRQEFQGRGAGTLLLLNALRRCAPFVENVGIFGVALNSMNERTTSFYHRYGFRQRGDAKYPLMVLPSQTLIELFENN